MLVHCAPDSNARSGHLAFGAMEYIALDLFLMQRAGDMPIETPGVRP
jgi:hypothetical protein